METPPNDEEEEIHRLDFVQPNTTPNLVDNVFRLKRKGNYDSASNKHQKFTDHSGRNIVVEKGVFNFSDSDNDDNEAGILPQRRGWDEEPIFVGRINPEDTLREQRKAERTVRHVDALQMLEDATEHKQMLSRGQRRLKTILHDNNYTYDDLALKVKLDEEGYRYVSVPSPMRAHINSLFGPEDIRSNCFACSRGVGLARVSENSLKTLEKTIMSLIGHINNDELSMLVSEHYEHQIRIPANKALRKGEAPLPEWPPRSVLDHITKHTKEPSFILSHHIGQITDHIDVLLDSTVYKVPIEIYTVSNRPVNKADIIVNPTGHRMLMDSYKMLLQFMNQKPDNMLFHNDNFNTTHSTTGILAPKYNVDRNTHTKSMFED